MVVGVLLFVIDGWNRMDRDLLIFVWIWVQDPPQNIVLIELILMVIMNQVIVSGQLRPNNLRTKEGGKPIKSLNQVLLFKSEKKISRIFW
jgi:hypothetical protein